MHPSFILPPSIKTQAQDKRRKKPAGHAKGPSVLAPAAWKSTWSDTRHAATTSTTQPPLRAHDNSSSQFTSALASIAGHSQSTQSLKRKLDAAHPLDHDAWTNLAAQRDTLSSQHQHSARAQNVSSQAVGHSGTIEAPTASRFIKSTKSIRSSEFAKSIILPTVDPAPSALKSKKEKFVPPLVRGGYAERLASLVGYHKSEYVMWANATLRRDKLFGSTEPLAVVCIKEISREHNLQWTRCSVICNTSNKPPFDVDPERPEFKDTDNASSGHNLERGGGLHEAIDVDIVEGGGGSQESNDAEIVKSTPDPNTIVRHSVESSLASQFTREEDSISGLHLNMGDMAVLSCTPETDVESVVEDSSRSQGCQSIFCDSSISIIQDEDTASKSFLNLKSSQGSDDEFEESTQIRTNHQSGVHAPLIVLPEPVGEIRLQCLDKESVDSPSDDIARRRNASEDIERATSATTSATDQSFSDGDVLASAISSIDDRTWSSTSAQVVMCTPVEELLSQDYTMPTQDSITASGQRRNVESEANFVIAFSNLFNWSTLKASDHVEIHEPCRHVVIPMVDSNARDKHVWIAERYKIVSTL
ncbi:hypothetical protein BGZ70_004130 [Mortierella alpina]|uniref:Uncharacterized protein n=1 Tax=Mortierella alpina TaxID=64518 RepID=A0A9P6JAK0_MORAP|nr:hypothetical protein BGZ70_004130 [Mortierella alpina]